MAIHTQHTGLRSLSLRQNLLDDVKGLEDASFSAGKDGHQFPRPPADFTELHLHKRLRASAGMYAAMEELILHDNHLKQVELSTPAVMSILLAPRFAQSHIHYSLVRDCAACGRSVWQKPDICASMQIPSLHRYTCLRRLELSYNQISSLQPLQHLASAALTELYIANNWVQRIEASLDCLRSSFFPLQTQVCIF